MDIPFISAAPPQQQLPDLEVKTEVSDEIDWEAFSKNQCTRCTLCKFRRNTVPPKLIENCGIMFVAEAPGETEDQWGTEPLIGAAGEKFNEMLAEVGIDRSSCSIANVCQCHPPQNRQPETAEIQACAPLLEAFITKAKPKVLVPLGAIALRRICGKAGITKLNGAVLEHARYPGVKIVPVFHPSYVLRDARNKEPALKALATVKTVAEGGGGSSFSNVTLVETIEQFDEMIAKLSAAPVYSFDIETSGFDFQKDHVICIAFSCEPGKSYVLPWVVGDDNYYKECRLFLETKRKDYVKTVSEFCEFHRVNHPTHYWARQGQSTYVRKKLQALFKQNNLKVLHNFKFDLKFLRRHTALEEFDFDFTTITDTMIIHYLLDERRGIHGLKDLVKIYTGFGSYEDSLTKCGFRKCDSSSDTFAIIPLDVLARYAGTDADATLQVYNILWPRLVQEGLNRFCQNFLMPLSTMLLEVEERGMTLDVEYMDKCIKTLETEIAKVDKDFEQYRWPDGEQINFNSNKQLIRFLFDVQGLPVLARTDKGFPSVEEEVLEKLTTLHDVPGKLLYRRKLAKALSTYFVGTKEVMYTDGKVHPGFLIHGTETGRLSATKPNCQNLPRSTELLNNLGVKIRNNFKCSNPDDYYLFECDYSQAELRLIAEYSRDPNLYRAFAENKDPHAMLAVRIYHPDLIPQMESDPTFNAKKAVTKDERQNGKTANFSLCYGKHWKNFATEHNMDPDVAKQIYEVYWSTYQGIKAWQDKVVNDARMNNDTFITYFGRKRRLPLLSNNDFFTSQAAARQGVNFVIQAQASDYTLYSAMLMKRAMREAQINGYYISFVHDSIVGEIHKSQLIQFIELLQKIMVHPPGVTIPMEVECKIGYKLGSLQVVEKDTTGNWKIPEIVA